MISRLVLLFMLISIVASQVSEVAFSAGVTKNLLLQHAETVVFDRIFTNIGNGYNSATGIFYCPTSGIYVFQFLTLASQVKSSWLELYQNADYMFIASTYGQTASDYDFRIKSLEAGFHTLAHQGKSSWLELYHNANYIASVYGHTASDYDSAGNSVVLKLINGDTVNIKVVDNRFGAETNIYGQSNEVYSTFSGYLIAPVF